MRKLIIKLLENILKEKKINLKKEEIENLIEIPPSNEMGDYAFPCFILSKKLKKNPNQIALEIKKKISNKNFEDVQVSGAYINFFVDKKKFAENIIKEILKEKEHFAISNIGRKEKTMVEFPSPNTNKPLHLGHLKIMLIGESISRILGFNSEKVIRANLNNDRGVHICKSMVAYKKYGKNKKPIKKSDHFVGDFYIRFNQMVKENKDYEKKAQECLQKWETKDKETLDLWKKMNKWALDGFKETYKKFGIKHDKEYYESKIYKKGKEIVLGGLKKGIFEKKDGSIIINLEKEKLGEKVLLRDDGTSLYITQDIYLAKLKQDEYKINKSIYVVGNEQEYHFKVLFTILLKLGFNYKNLKHLSCGMVNLPEGKMKSREGTVVDADNLIKEVQDLVKKELTSREKISKKELESRSLKIALSAIKYFLLKVDSKKNMLFNPKESISFEGDTGPYLLYSYARAFSILRKSKNKLNKNNFQIKNISEHELKLIKKLSEFPEIILRAYKNLNPSLIANYSYQLAQIFNEFYHSCPVIGSSQEIFRIKLVKSFKQVLESSLYLLGIKTIDKM
jgi:arginyl-tRNA synthetase